jgi:hypothetical protein
LAITVALTYLTGEKERETLDFTGASSFQDRAVSNLEGDKAGGRFGFAHVALVATIGSETSGGAIGPRWHAIIAVLIHNGPRLGQPYSSI